MKKWQPIETAPLDGTPVLLFCPGIRSYSRKLGEFEIVVGIFEVATFKRLVAFPGGCWFSDIADIDPGYESTGPWLEYEPLRPTHWMSLPEPPQP